MKIITLPQLLLLVCFSFYAETGLGAHGISIDGATSYGADFSHFNYTSDNAVKGGSVNLYDLGSFDSFNPYLIKGSSPLGLEKFVFDTLGVASLDEPFSVYGLLAKDILLAEDGLSVTFTLRENARFSDGSPVTADDVAFSLEMLKSDKVLPFYASYYQDITGSEIVGDKSIRFIFREKNRELHLIAAQLPVFSQSFYEKYGFSDAKTVVPPLGSGPYIVDKYEFGKFITYKRNTAYWAQNLNVRKNMFNFDTITVKYYKDPTIALEALKAGEFDFMAIYIAKQWAKDLGGKKIDEGTLLKKAFPHKNNAGLQGFVFNTRKKIFQDVRVRKALGLAFDFEWTNKSLFYDQYTRNNSFFSNSYLAASGLPQGLELDYLEEVRDLVPTEVFTTVLQAPVNNDSTQFRKNLRQAKNLLAQSGWKVKNGILVNNEGEKFSFEILLVNRTFERVMAPYVNNLKKLGIDASYKTIDPALYMERRQQFDFDMIVASYGQSLSPGNEQRSFFSSQAAGIKGSRNYAGIRSKAVDRLIEKIVYAENREALTAACKALDRTLWYGYYIIPNWYIASTRLVFSNKFQYPETLPLYYDSLSLLTTWWVTPE